MKPFIKPVQEKNQMKKVKCKMIYNILPVGILLLIYFSWLYMYKVYLYDFILFDKHNACFYKVDLTGIETGIFGALITAFAIVFSFIKEKILGHTNKIWALRPEYHIFLLTPYTIIILLLEIICLSIIAVSATDTIGAALLFILFISLTVYLLFIIHNVIDKKSFMITKIAKRIVGRRKFFFTKPKINFELIQSISKALQTQYLYEIKEMVIPEEIFMKSWEGYAAVRNFISIRIKNSHHELYIKNQWMKDHNSYFAEEVNVIILMIILLKMNKTNENDVKILEQILGFIVLREQKIFDINELKEKRTEHYKPQFAFWKYMDRIEFSKLNTVYVKIEDIKAFMNNNFHMINFSVENDRKDFNTLLHSI